MFTYRGAVAVAAMVVAFVMPGSAAAAPGDFDTSFGTAAGRTDLTSTFGPTAAEDVASTPDGKLVTVGQVVHNQTIGDQNSPLVHDWIVARLTADGQPDTTFHGNGVSQPLLVQTGVTPSPDDSNGADDLEVGSRGATALAVLSNGDILITGQDAGNGAPVTVLKVQGSGGTGDGTLVTSFGNNSNGSATIPLVNSTRTTSEAIAVAPDGTIIVTGHAFISGIEKSFVARFNSDGTPDSSFNGGSAVLLLPDSSCDDVGAASSCDANSLALETSGSSVTAIFVGGWNGGDQVGGRIWKLIPGTGQSNFALDTAFWDPKGAVWLPRDTLSNVQTLLVQSDGQVVAAGYHETDNNSEQCGFARLSSSGALSASGQVTLGGTCIIRGLARAADGSYPFAGEVWSGIQRSGSEQILVGRFDASGHADTTFAPAGAVAQGTPPTYAAGMTLVGDKTVVAGADSSPRQLMVARFLGGSGATDVTPPAVTLDKPADQAVLTSGSSGAHPVLSGAAGTAPGDLAQVTILWKNLTTGAPLAKYQATVNGGNWTYAPTSVGPGEYRVQAIQSDAAGNVGQSAVHTFWVEPVAVHNPINTAQQRQMPNVVGQGVGPAVTLIAKDLVYADVNYKFVHDVSGCSTAADVSKVMAQTPAAGTVSDSDSKPVEVTLSVCFGGEKAIASCDTTSLNEGLHKLGLKLTDQEVIQDFISAYNKCVDSYKVSITPSSAGTAQPDFTNVTATQPTHGAGTIHSVLDCPADPQAEDLRIGLSEGAAAQGVIPADHTVASWGFRASGPEGWTLPYGYPSYFKVTVLDRAQQPVQALIYVDPSDVSAPGFTKPVAVANDVGEQKYLIQPGHAGVIKICAVLTVGDQDLYGTAEIRVVAPPAPGGGVWETTTGRRIEVRKCPPKAINCESGDAIEAPASGARAASAAASDPLSQLINFIVSLFGGHSQSVSQAGASNQSASYKLQTVYAANSVAPLQVNTCGTELSSDPPKPVLNDAGAMFGKLGSNVGSITGPVFQVPGGKCGAVVMGTEAVSAAEAQKAGVKPGLISNDGGSIVSTNGSNIVAQGGGNLISNDGGSLIGELGSGIISNDGSTLKNDGGGRIVSTGGSNNNLLAAGGPAGLGPDVAKIVAQGGGNIVAQGGGNLVTGKLP